MRGGDTYLTEMIGVAISKRAWPEGGAEYVEAVGAIRVAHLTVASGLGGSTCDGRLVFRFI
jgi:hypothetical protein